VKGKHMVRDEVALKIDKALSNSLPRKKPDFIGKKENKKGKREKKRERERE
jgi:hypothetical protein